MAVDSISNYPDQGNGCKANRVAARTGYRLGSEDDC